ncbi:MAG: FemAB family PEP-CTERM system-associated protein [Deltaproteobacteria bacterium]|nr:FemAB family PEP-CTERM system-associated protein [Deltaproteobacteria bacterium]
MRIERLSEVDGVRWDAWVKPRTRTATDLDAWRNIVRETYGMGSYFLVAIDAGEIQGALALYEVRHRIFGHYLTTAPFANDGGLIYESRAARDALLAEAKRLCNAQGAAYALIRTAGEDLPNYVPHHHYRTAIIDLRGGPEALWKRLPAKTRNQVRRGQKESFTISQGDIDGFFEVFHEHMRDLGSPAHPRRYYRAIAKHLGGIARFFVVRDGALPVAGAMVFALNDTVANLHTVALREHNRRCPNYLLYWHMLETAAREGYARFDMGRSVEGSSNLHFKENWGPEISPLSYNFHLQTAPAVPFSDPRNPVYRLPIAVWRKLPLAVTRLLGPHIINGLA